MEGVNSSKKCTHGLHLASIHMYMHAKGEGVVS